MVEERKITLLLTFSIANHCIPKKFEFPILRHLLPLLCIRCLEPTDQTDHVKGCQTIRIRKEKNVGRSSPDEQREDSKLLLQEDPKTMKKSKFSALRIWVIIPKHEGCGFPWKAFTVGLLTLPPSVGSWKTFHSDEQQSWKTLLRFFFKVASVLGILGRFPQAKNRPRRKAFWVQRKYGKWAVLKTLHDGIFIRILGSTLLSKKTTNRVLDTARS